MHIHLFAVPNPWNLKYSQRHIVYLFFRKTKNYIYLLLYGYSRHRTMEVLWSNGLPAISPQLALSWFFSAWVGSMEAGYRIVLPAGLERKKHRSLSSPGPAQLVTWHVKQSWRDRVFFPVASDIYGDGLGKRLFQRQRGLIPWVSSVEVARWLRSARSPFSPHARGLDTKHWSYEAPIISIGYCCSWTPKQYYLCVWRNVRNLQSDCNSLSIDGWFIYQNKKILRMFLINFHYTLLVPLVLP
jgi:hypothetical protein